MQLFKFRLEQIVKSPWYIISLLPPLGIVFSDHLTIESKVLFVGQIYLSVAFTVLITFAAWDYLKLRGLENHIMGLYILPLVLVIFLPKYGHEIWLVLNPLGGWTYGPYWLCEKLGIQTLASLPLSFLFLPLVLLLQRRFLGNWYY